MFIHIKIWLRAWSTEHWSHDKTNMLKISQLVFTTLQGKDNKDKGV